MIDKLENLNYKTYIFVLNSKDFGVPQNRKRIYIVGFNVSLVPNYSSFKEPSPLFSKTKVGNILEKEVDGKYTISTQLWEGHRRRKRIWFFLIWPK
ncbi:DNA cytosine methyltransferase [Mycoplasma ovis]|uniref:DNA cytosine methyltransferase n=1 Tax=Mycoplasma ovis TaxID=171632 RepID=UPI002E112153|nr:DNA cytosine methyltransferase [Mycoplasma ovis]